MQVKRQNPSKEIRYAEAIENSREWICEKEIKDYTKKAANEIQQLCNRSEELADRIVSIYPENSDLQKKKSKQKLRNNNTSAVYRSSSMLTFA
jgi:hypothetical protein